MWNVEIQQLDHDDYRVGSPLKIGPFDSKEAAEEFLEASGKFNSYILFGDYRVWKYLPWVTTTHRVGIDKVTHNFRDLKDYM